VAQLTVPFGYNDLASLERVFGEHPGRVAAVIMEPCRYNDPAPGFLEFVRDGVHRAGGLLIYDEISIGWRLHFGGAHLRFGIQPDLAVFAKTMSNGHPMAAIIGTRAAMEGAHKSFISSSYWTEAVGPAAALATIHKMQQVNVPAHVARIGARVMEAWRRAAHRHHLPVVVEEGYPCMAHFKFDHAQAAELKTLFTQLMLERGFLASLLFYPTLAHTDKIVDRYAEAVEAAFAQIAALLDADKVKEALKGPVAHSGFQRLL
jgi:glutamate-1-semialdehyde 2,1-aminomutase